VIVSSAVIPFLYQRRPLPPLLNSHTGTIYIEQGVPAYAGTPLSASANGLTVWADYCASPSVLRRVVWVGANTVCSVTKPWPLADRNTAPWIGAKPGISVLTLRV